jgi:MarR family transcriptional regulator, lower aerobic nicotinate degradation pathway regulator
MYPYRLFLRGLFVKVSPSNLVTPRRTGTLLRKAHQAAVAIFVREAKHLALTPPQHNVLTALAANHGCHQTELGRAVGYDRATVGAVLAGLETRKLIKRTLSATDRRSKTLTITPKGRKLLASAAPVLQRINDALVAPLDAAEREHFIALLTKVAYANRDRSA